MTFHTLHAGRAVGGYARPTNTSANKSPRVAICFDRETFDELSAAASRRGVSFSQVVREYVARGLSDDAQRGAQPCGS